jgi:hypothetical protein
MFFSSIIFRDFKNAKIIFWGTVISSSAVLSFQFFRLFMPKFLSFGILGANTDNIVGSWNTLGIFAGLSVVISLFAVEFFSISKIKKILLIILSLLSLTFIAVINFSIVWWVLGILTLIIFIYKVSFHSRGEQVIKRSFPIFSFVVIMVSLFFLMAGQFITGFLPDNLKVSNIDIRPSFATTISVTKATLATNPILGAGPNRFAEMWAMHKPIAINSSDFWNTSFNDGSGTLPTFAITTGFLGILAWLIFIGFLLVILIKAFFVIKKKDLLNMEAILFFIMSFYLFILSFFYSMGFVLFPLAFIFLGIFIGLSSSETKKEIKISFLDDPRKSFFSILLLIIIMIISAAALFKYTQRFISVFYFQKTFTAQNVESAEYSISKAVNLYPNDLYLRTYVQVNLSKIDSLIAKGSLSETDKADLKLIFDQAVVGAQLAINYNKTNFLNHELLGSLYELGASLGVTDAYSKATETYKEALRLNPLDPSIKLVLARVSFNSGDFVGAKNYTN